MAVLDRELHVFVDRALYEAMSEQAQREDRPLSRLVRQALRAHLGVTDPKDK